MQKPPPTRLSEDQIEDEEIDLSSDDSISEELANQEDGNNSSFMRTLKRRWGLYVPFLLLALACVAWLMSWMVIRKDISLGIAHWMAQEEREGRQWACPQQTVSGFPFRIEVRCQAPNGHVNTVIGPIRMRVNALNVVGQVFASGHYIAEVEGPFSLAFPQGEVFEINWKTLQISLQENRGVLTRLSALFELAAFRLTLSSNTPNANTSNVLYAEKLAVHVRPNPERWNTDSAYDLAMEAENIASPQLDDIVGGKEPLQLAVESTISHMLALTSRPLPMSLDIWRLNGGRLTLSPLHLRKGDRQVILRGDLTLDPQRRIEGRLDISAAGLDTFLQYLAGNNPQTLALISSGLSFLNPGASQNPDAQSPQRVLKSMPPLRFEKGRVFIGPLAIGKLAPLM
jgi:hypothetical protein